MCPSVNLAGAATVLLPALFVLSQHPAPEVTARWTPFVAKQTVRRYEITSTGKRCVHEETGVRMQDGNGSTYTRTILVRGDPAEQTADAVLDDAPTGTTYRIDYSRREAHVMRRPPPGPYKPKSPENGDFLKQYAGDQIMEKRTISGVECIRYGAPMAGSDELVDNCVAPVLNYFPVFIRMPLGPGLEQEILLEDIRVGEVPDPQFFRIPEGFKVVD